MLHHGLHLILRILSSLLTNPVMVIIQNSTSQVPHVQQHNLYFQHALGDLPIPTTRNDVLVKNIWSGN
jgi:hypothetical protein